MKLKTGRHTSAIKAWRKSEKLASRNRGIKARIHDITKEFKANAAKKDLEQAQKILPKAMSMLDKAAKVGTIHWKAAARRKSRMTAALNSMISK